MVATDQEPQQQTYQGLLDFLIKEEEKRNAIRQAANNVGSAAAMMQQFDVASPRLAGMGGGLLQQPMHPEMSAPGQGIMGMTPQGDADKLAKMKAFLGLG
jgi:hypothetical protein